jgi:hypothetical protein
MARVELFNEEKVAMADLNERIEKTLASHPILLFMKGTPDFPQCGFSAAGRPHAARPAARASAPSTSSRTRRLRDGLKALFELADLPAAVRQRRAHRRL